MTYRVEQYRDNDTGRYRWAVLDTTTRVWYFPSRYGRKAAKAMADKLNREAS